MGGIGFRRSGWHSRSGSNEWKVFPACSSAAARLSLVTGHRRGSCGGRCTPLRTHCDPLRTTSEPPLPAAFGDGLDVQSPSFMHTLEPARAHLRSCTRATRAAGCPHPACVLLADDGRGHDSLPPLEPSSGADAGQVAARSDPGVGQVPSSAQVPAPPPCAAETPHTTGLVKGSPPMPSRTRHPARRTTMMTGSSGWKLRCVSHRQSPPSTCTCMCLCHGITSSCAGAGQEEEGGACRDQDRERELGG